MLKYQLLSISNTDIINPLNEFCPCKKSIFCCCVNTVNCAQWQMSIFLNSDNRADFLVYDRDSSVVEGDGHQTVPWGVMEVFLELPHGEDACHPWTRKAPLFPILCITMELNRSSFAPQWSPDNGDSFADQSWRDGTNL